MYFGTHEVVSYMMDSKYQITVVSPTVTAEESVEIIIVQGNRTYSTGSNEFKYKNYFSLVSIYPSSGPGRGGTVVKIEYTGKIEENVLSILPSSIYQI
mmetsp:Transcript_42772/g.50144  ORF Transcript_42772/g.50144 Transcript_42772/m.50144 type:complete len:98 (-) Transcript_42772:2163-2456(-)